MSLPSREGKGPSEKSSTQVGAGPFEWMDGWMDGNVRSQEDITRSGVSKNDESDLLKTSRDAWKIGVSAGSMENGCI